MYRKQIIINNTRGSAISRYVQKLFYWLCLLIGQQ